MHLVAVLEHHARGPPVLRQNLRDRAPGANLRAEAPRRVADGVGDRAGPAARQAPGAEGAVDLAHVVVQQDVGGARRPHAEERADDARRAHRGLQHVGLEPLIEEVHRAHRQELHLVDAIVRPHPAEAPAQADELEERARVRAWSGPAASWPGWAWRSVPSRPSHVRIRRRPRRPAANGARSRAWSSRGRSPATSSRRRASA